MHPYDSESKGLSLKDRFVGINAKREAFENQTLKYSKDLQEGQDVRQNRAHNTAVAEFSAFRLANPAYESATHPEYEGGLVSAIKNAEHSEKDGHNQPVPLEMTGGKLSSELEHDNLVATAVAKIKETYGENPTFYHRMEKGLEKLTALFAGLENSPYKAPLYQNKEDHMNIIKQIQSEIETLKQFALNVVSFENDPKVLEALDALGIKLSNFEAGQIKDYLTKRLEYSQQHKPGQHAGNKPLGAEEYQTLITRLDSLTA